MKLLTPIIPAILPLATMIWLRHNEYDFIIVGGESAGATLANRLSEMYEYSVLLLEAGGSESLLSDISIVAATLQMTPIDWAYQSEPQQQSCFGLINRRSRWPRGRVLGGSSVLNYMLYVRGNSRDYDNWYNLGNPGWNWRNILPLFIKSEDNQGTDNLSPGYHGTGGYLTVNTPQDLSPVGQVFTRAGEYLGYSTLDYNGPIHLD